MHENKFALTPTCTSRTFPWSPRHRRLLQRQLLKTRSVTSLSHASFNHFCANVILIGNAHICASWRIRSAWSHILVHQNSSMCRLCWLLLKMPMFWEETVTRPNWCSNKHVLNNQGKFGPTFLPEKFSQNNTEILHAQFDTMSKLAKHATTLNFEFFRPQNWIKLSKFCMLSTIQKHDKNKNFNKITGTTTHPAIRAYFSQRFKQMRHWKLVKI